MVIERRLPDLLSLLESHAGTTMHGVPVILRPPTPIILAPVQIKPVDKKRKMERIGGKGVVEEGEVQEETHPKPTKVVKITHTQQRKGVESSSTASERRSKKVQTTTNKKLKETLQKLAKCDKARKSIKASIESIERQAREQLVQLKEDEKQLALAQTTIIEMRKELVLEDKKIKKAEKMAYDQGQKETKTHLNSQLPVAKLGDQQSSTLVPTKTKQTELVVSKVSTTDVQGTEGVAKAIPPTGDPSTNAPPTTLASSAPTLTHKVQTTIEIEAQKTSKP
nr:hypothetical protein CFP56_29313 [Quercus suber]